MANDPFYLQCCLRRLQGIVGPCSGRIEWHHVLIVGGRQLNEKFAIVPACHGHHEKAAKLNEYFQYVALNRATDSELRAISKAVPYIELRDRLNKKFGYPQFLPTTRSL